MGNYFTNYGNNVELSIGELREITKNKKDEKDRKFKRDLEIKKLNTFKYHSTYINNIILEKSNNGESFLLTKIPKEINDMIFNYYNKKKFKIKRYSGRDESQTYEIQIDWGVSYNYTSGCKKLRKIINSIIFIRRLREQYYNPDGTYNKKLKLKYN